MHRKHVRAETRVLSVLLTVETPALCDDGERGGGYRVGQYKEAANDRHVDIGYTLEKYKVRCVHSKRSERA